MPAASTPWREATFSVVDLELTGLDPASDEVISFAAVTVANGRIRLDDALYLVIRPERMPDADTIRIHGLRESDLIDAPPLRGVIDEVLRSLTGRALVAHVAAVERGFLETALETVAVPLRNPVIDTAGLALELRRLRREPPPAARVGTSSGIAGSSPGLSDVARSLGLPVHRPHHAQGDALTAAQAFIALATHLEQFGPQTVGSLVRISRPERGRISPVRLLRRFGLGRRDA